MQYRKKPVVIDAEQWFPGRKIDGVEEFETGDPITEIAARVVTLEGAMVAMPGDWIITGVKGEKYPCKPDIFELTYESTEAPCQCKGARFLRHIESHLAPRDHALCKICGQTADQINFLAELK